MMKTDLTFDDAMRLAHKICRDEDMAQESLLHAWDSLSRGKCGNAEFPVRMALWRGIHAVRAGHKMGGNRIRHEKWERKPRPDVHRMLPLSPDDYTGRAGLVCAQEFRMALATDDSDVIDALYAVA